MSDTFCPTCDKSIGGGTFGWEGHLTSKAHKANVEQFGAPPEVVELSVEELKTALAKAEEERDEALAAKARAESDRQRFMPYADMPIIRTADDVLAHFGEEALRSMAEGELAIENKRRQKDGRPPLWSEDKAYYEKLIRDLMAKLAQEMSQERSRALPDDPKKILRMRTAKMVFPIFGDGCDDNPKTPCYRHGSIRQIPLEGTINNGAGSIADPIERYKRKGAKLAFPIRCLLRDCDEAEALDPVTGQRLWGGYCSETHLRVMEGQMVQGITGRVPVVESVMG
jgi:hypothetical protein